MQRTWQGVAVVGAVLAVAMGAPPDCLSVHVVNGGFEQPVVRKGAANNYPAGAVPGWFTTASDAEIELWGPGNAWANKGMEVTPAEGSQLAELDANEPATLYQDFTTIPGMIIQWSVAHRARNTSPADDADEMFVELGSPRATVPQVPDGLREPYLMAGDTAWTIWQGRYRVPDGQTVTRIAFRPLHSSSGSSTTGNLIDDVKVRTISCPRATPPLGGSGGSLPVTGHRAWPLGVILLATGAALLLAASVTSARYRGPRRSR